VTSSYLNELPFHIILGTDIFAIFVFLMNARLIFLLLDKKGNLVNLIMEIISFLKCTN
jgi:hypothetical protein